VAVFHKLRVWQVRKEQEDFLNFHDLDGNQNVSNQEAAACGRRSLFFSCSPLQVSKKTFFELRARGGTLDQLSWRGALRVSNKLAHGQIIHQGRRICRTGLDPCFLILRFSFQREKRHVPSSTESVED
jgi:hypothetical protein